MTDNWIRGKILSPNLRAYLITDEAPENPRTGGLGREPLGTIVMFGEHADLADVKPNRGPGAFLLETFAGLVPEVGDEPPCAEVSEISDAVRRAMAQAPYPGLFLELDCVHSDRHQFDCGKFGARWFAWRQVGYYFVSEQRLAERGLNRMEGAAVMLGELAQYEEYLNGKVFAMVLERDGVMVAQRRNVLNTRFTLGRAERLNRWPDDAALDLVLDGMMGPGQRASLTADGWFSPQAGAPMVPISEPWEYKDAAGPGHDHYHYVKEFYGQSVVQSFLDSWERALTNWNGTNTILGHDDPDCQRS